jgi:hypothetical protein
MTINDKRNKLEDQWKKCLQWDNDTKKQRKQQQITHDKKETKGKRPT